MSKKKTFAKIFYEIFIVTLGILIALFINNLKSDIDEKKYLKKTFSSIRSEIVENIKEIKETLPLQDSLDTHIYNNISNDKNILSIIAEFGGVTSPVIKASAWNSILNNNAHLIEYETISKLTEIELGVQEYNMKVMKMIDFVYENAEATSSNKKDLFSIIIQDLLLLEESLIEVMEKFLEQTEHLI